MHEQMHSLWPGEQTKTPRLVVKHLMGEHPDPGPGSCYEHSSNTLVACTLDLPALLPHPLVVDYGTEVREDWVGRVQFLQDLHVIVVAQHNTRTLNIL